jgi:hypothetical protein
MYIPSSWGHSVTNLDDTVSITENFLAKRAFKDELPLFKAYDRNPFQYDCNGCVERIWRNLMNKVLRNDTEARTYARKMLQQVLKHKEETLEEEE